MRFGSFGSYTAVKSVSSLFSRKPRPGTTMPEPPVCSIVSVYETTLPQRSDVTRCEVEVPTSLRPTGGAVVQPVASRAPGCVGVGRARSVIWQARERANGFDSSVFSGTSTKAGSPT